MSISNDYVSSRAPFHFPVSHTYVLSYVYVLHIPLPCQKKSEHSFITKHLVLFKGSKYPLWFFVLKALSLPVVVFVGGKRKGIIRGSLVTENMFFTGLLGTHPILSFLLCFLVIIRWAGLNHTLLFWYMIMPRIQNNTLCDHRLQALERWAYQPFLHLIIWGVVIQWLKSDWLTYKWKASIHGICGIHSLSIYLGNSTTFQKGIHRENT